MHCGPPNENFGWALAHMAYPVAPPWVLGDAVRMQNATAVGAPVAFCCIECFQNASGRNIFGSLVSIAMSGKMKANPGSGRIWYLLATYAI